MWSIESQLKQTGMASLKVRWHKHDTFHGISDLFGISKKFVFMLVISSYLMGNKGRI